MREYQYNREKEGQTGKHNVSKPHTTQQQQQHYIYIDDEAINRLLSISLETHKDYPGGHCSVIFDLSLINWGGLTF